MPNDPAPLVQEPPAPVLQEAPAEVQDGDDPVQDPDHPADEVVISTHLQNFLFRLADILPNLVSVKAKVRAREFGTSAVIPKILVDVDFSESWLAEPPIDMKSDTIGAWPEILSSLVVELTLSHLI